MRQRGRRRKVGGSSILAVAGTAAVAVALVSTAYLPRFQPDAAPAAVRAPMLVSVRLNGPFDPGFAGEMVAARAGLFEREGLSVDLKPGGAEVDPVRLVGGGTDAIGVAGAESVILARAKGVPIVAFAAAFLESPVVLYALEKSAIRAPNDLGGKRIGYQPGQDTAIAYQALMARLRIARGMVHEIRVGSDMAPFLNGEVDVWPGHIGVEAFTLKQTGIGYNVISPASHGVHVPGTAYFAAEATIRENPELILRFLRAVIAGWEMTYADYAKSIPLIASFDAETLTPELIRFRLDQQRAVLRPLGARFGEFDSAHWRSLQDILVQQKLLKEPIELSKAVSFEFLRDSYRRSGALLSQ
jgi:ABC-type nitrate/sulfonate/bicarbonate transport system substrate-binding protein